MNIKRVITLLGFDFYHSLFRLKGLAFLIPFAVFWYSMLRVLNEGGSEFLSSIEGLMLIKVEKVSKDAGIDKYLQKAEIKSNFVELIGTLFEWLVILIFFLAAVDILGLSVV